jgi:hypothetical protein
MEHLLIAPRRELAPGELVLHPLRIGGGATSTLTVGERQAILRLVGDHQGMMLIGRRGRRQIRCGVEAQCEWPLRGDVLGGWTSE